MPLETLANPPVIVMLPTKDLVVPPWNPRKFMSEEGLRVLTARIAEGRFVPRLWVWKGTGEAPWQVISGQRRLEAYRRLGKTMVQVEIMDITLEDAQITADTSNEGEPVYWLDSYENWVARMEERKWNQTQTAVKFGQQEYRIYWAIQMNILLSDHSRGLIREHLKDSQADRGEESHKNLHRLIGYKTVTETQQKLDEETPSKGPTRTNWQLTENVAIQLIPLLNSPNWEVARELADKAVEAILAGKMTGPQVKELVAHLLSGKDLARFEPPAKGKKGKPAGNGKKNQTGAGNAQNPTVEQPEGNPVGVEALSGTGSTGSPQAPTTPAGGSGQAGVAASPSPAYQKPEVATSQTEPIGSAPRNDGKGMAQTMTGAKDSSLDPKSVNNPAKKALIVAFFVVLAGWVGWNWFPKAFMGKNPMYNGLTGESPYVPTKPNTRKTDSPSLKGKEGGFAPSTIKKAKAIPASRQAGPTVPDTLKDRVEADSQEALHFTQVFYGTSYQTRSQWEDYFKGILAEDYGQKFVDTYFPQAVIQGMIEEKTTQSFEPSGPVRLLRVGGQSDDFRVEGTVTTQKGSDPSNQAVTSMPVALVVGFWHDGKVYKVELQH